MSKMKILKIGAINIKVHPHSSQIYIDLIRAASEYKAVKIWGSEYGRIGTVHEHKINEGTVLVGDIFKFLHIDPLDPWLDLNANEPIKNEDGKTPVIPEHLKPNLRTCEYVFYPKHHRLFFNAGVIAHSRMKRLFTALLSLEKIQEEFGFADIEVESSYEAFERILAMQKITKLDIRITIPNSDDWGKLEKRFHDRLQAQNIRNFKQETSSRHEEGIKPDDETQALMKVALSNGKVEATGYEHEERTINSSEEHPLFEMHRYNADLISPREALIVGAAEMLPKIIR